MLLSEVRSWLADRLIGHAGLPAMTA